MKKNYTPPSSYKFPVNLFGEGCRYAVLFIILLVIPFSASSHLDNRFSNCEEWLDSFSDFPILMGTSNSQKADNSYSLMNTHVTSVSPSNGQNYVPLDSEIVITFDGDLDASSLANSITVIGLIGGSYPGTITLNSSNTIQFIPSSSFFPGDKIQVTVTAHLLDSSASPVVPFHSYFFTETKESNCTFNPVRVVLPPLEPAPDGSVAISLFDDSIADMDGDGDLDIIYVYGKKIGWERNDGDFTFTNLTMLDDPGAGEITSINTTDLDGDGDIDIVFSDRTLNFISWLQNDGSENFTRINIPTTGLRGTNIKTGDIEGDGDEDLVINFETSNRISLFVNDGNENFTENIILQSSTLIRRSLSSQLVDLDSDGDLDIPIVGPSFRGRWFRNDAGLDGLPNFTLRQTDIENNTSQPVDVNYVDVDDDGDIDLAIGGYGSRDVKVYENNGNEIFTSVVSLAMPRSGVLSFLVDVDGDNDIDFLTYDIFPDPTNRYFWENDGLQAFNQLTLGTVANFWGGGMAYGDFNNNGVLEVVIPGLDNAGTITIIRLEDTEAPIITCQLEATITADEDACSFLVTDNSLDASFTDNCTAVLSNNFTNTETLKDAELPVGTHTITWKANDGINEVSCEQIIIIKDQQAPVITNFPDNGTIEIGNETEYLVPDFWSTSGAIATDNCPDSIITLTQSPAVGSLLAPGVYTVTLFARDEADNETANSFDLTVEQTLSTLLPDEIDNSFVIYPNPSSSKVYIRYPNTITLELLKLYDLNGHLLRTFPVLDLGEELGLDISDLSAGVYMLSIISERKTITKQLIVN